MRRLGGVGGIWSDGGRDVDFVLMICWVVVSYGFERWMNDELSWLLWMDLDGVLFFFFGDLLGVLWTYLLG
jgi:hypothetical protein